VRLLTVREAAKRAGVCVGIVYGWISGRLLPFYRLGRSRGRGKIMIAEDDLDVFLASRRVEALQPPPPPAKPAPRGGDGFGDYYQKVMEQVARKRRR
jgi:excisionase family DNA binding protein